MLLYTNGCSHTAGDDHALGPDYGLKVWAHQLFRMITNDQPGTHNLINKAISGNNNQLLSSRVIRDLQNCKPDYAVIQFTHPNRFWTPGNSHQPGGHYISTNLETGVGQLNKHKDSVNKKFYQKHFMTRYAYVECTNQMIATIKYIETFLKSINVPYTFIVWSRILAANYDKFESTLDHSRILNYDYGEYFEMDKMMHTYGFKYPEYNMHFEEPGQKFIAKAVHKHIIDGTKLVPKHKISSDSNHEYFIDSLY